MSESRIRLYGIPLSHPVLAARAMLDRKGLDYRYVELMAGAHPPSLWALGFRRITVPALRLRDGRRVQGSLAIARALDELVPDPPLYPADPEARAAAEAAERWGEAVLQPIPRRLTRWGLRSSLRQRQWFADVGTPLPAPALMGRLLSPLATLFALLAKADDHTVHSDVTRLPALLDEVDRLLAAGVIGGAELGAADFQIGCSVRVLVAMEDVGRLVAGRPAEAFARRAIPSYPPIPAVLPADWLAGARTARSG